MLSLIKSAYIIYEWSKSDGTTTVSYPTLEYRSEMITRGKVNNLIGINATTQEIAALLSRMCLGNLNAFRILKWVVEINFL